MSPSRVPDGGERGHIVPIGGAENKENDPKILARFVQVSGGEDADIVVIPTASRAHETGSRYEKLFQELGARRVDVMDFDTRRDCQELRRLERIEQATGIFFTGGNQLRLTTLLGGTPVDTFSYPFGAYDANSLYYLDFAGYIAAVGLGVDMHQGPGNIYYLYRRDIKGTYDLKRFAQFLPWQGDFENLLSMTVVP